MSKNIIKFMLIVLIGCIVINSIPVYAGDPFKKNGMYTKEESGGGSTSTPSLSGTTTDNTNFTCQNYNIRRAVMIVSEVLWWIRIIIPVFVIISAMINFSKAVLSQDDNDIQAVFWDLIKKVILGAMVFFIPAIVIATLKGISSYSGLMANWKDCITLLK